MNRRVLRIIVPLAVGAVALSLVLVLFVARGKGTGAPIPASPGATAASATAPANGAAPTSPPVPAADPEVLARLLAGARARAPATGTTGHDVPAATLGSLDPAQAPFLVEFSRAGAGIKRLVFSDIFETAEGKRAAEAARSAGKPLPAVAEHYLLLEPNPLARGTMLDVPALAANELEIEGRRVNVFDWARDPVSGDPVFVWSETGPGRFETEIVNDAGETVLRVTRSFRLRADYDIDVAQTIENFTAVPLSARWRQFFPGELRIDRARYIDMRRVRVGYQIPSGRIAADKDYLFDRTSVLKRWSKWAAKPPAEQTLEELRLWPDAAAAQAGEQLTWFGTSNRYFVIAVHPTLPPAGAPAPVLDAVTEVLLEGSAIDADGDGRPDREFLHTHLASAERSVPAGGTLELSFGLYAGPLDRKVLEAEPYTQLSMDDLILYQMSSFCAFCTFQWLAHGLVAFLDILHDWVVFDWGVAIICLVLIVRTLLHPITKRSQIGMQRFGKVMQELKPQIDRLQKKYPNDPKTLQQEQLRLMREHGVNPLQMLGCLPMFLQTPIWIALYAMLYFAFDLRQQPAFFGFFQLFGDWPFLGDLSAGDHFFWEFEEPVDFLWMTLTGINLLPILMGAIFFFQQKYLTPPPSPTMTKEQLQQQKIMKFMMVVLFPIMLYAAPSGLTLYIITSSLIGIVESRYIRRHVTEMDLKPKKPKATAKPKDAQGRAYAAAIERLEEARRRRALGPEKKFKKRKA